VTAPIAEKGCLPDRHAADPRGMVGFIPHQRH
jgi:hypothetical protein